MNYDIPFTDSSNYIYADDITLVAQTKYLTYVRQLSINIKIV